MTKKWWMESFGYQIYIRSYYDSNNDGIGDLRGITEKLEYLHFLGVNLIWLCPFYDSPMDDNGYDVRDYLKVSSDYGTNTDIKELIDKAHKLGIKVIIDLVLNHTSDEHKWFRESKKSKDNKYRDYYIWKKGKNNTPPTNWPSFFGGSSWKYDSDTDEYYLKIFSDKMPDLNWENDEVKKEMVSIIKYWLDLGIDGFRVDATSHLAKGEFKDVKDGENPYKYFCNLEKLHSYINYLNKEAFSKYDIMTVGEVGGGAKISDYLKYTKPERCELNMAFTFDHNWSNHAWEVDDPDDLRMDLINLKQIFNKWQTGLYGKSWNALYWLNHDHPRVISHYGNTKKYHKESGKMLATALYFMWGTPFIYNGEEIGMTNPDFKTIDDFKDVNTKTLYNIRKQEPNFDEYKFIRQTMVKCRDNARTIMQWDNTKNAGFSNHAPWNYLTSNYVDINVKDEIDDIDSILNYYRKVIDIRLHSKYNDIVVYGKYKQIMKQNKDIYAYIRELDNTKILIITNFSDKKLKLSHFKYEVKDIILSNYNKTIFDKVMLPYEAIVLDISTEEK